MWKSGSFHLCGEERSKLANLREPSEKGNLMQAGYIKLIRTQRKETRMSCCVV
jgi:hypothetical protein